MVRQKSSLAKVFKFITAQEADLTQQACTVVESQLVRLDLSILALASHTDGFSSEWNIDGGLHWESGSHKGESGKFDLPCLSTLQFDCPRVSWRKERPL